jgi:hypothetical protein
VTMSVLKDNYIIPDFIFDDHKSEEELLHIFKTVQRNYKTGYFKNYSRQQKLRNFQQRKEMLMKTA